MDDIFNIIPEAEPHKGTILTNQSKPTAEDIFNHAAVIPCATDDYLMLPCEIQEAVANDGPAPSPDA